MILFTSDFLKLVLHVSMGEICYTCIITWVEDYDQKNDEFLFRLNYGRIQNILSYLKI